MLDAELGDDFPLSDAEIADLFAAMQAELDGIYAAEQEANRLLRERVIG